MWAPPKRDQFQKIIKAANGEAAGNGSKRIGTDHLLLGLLHVPEALPDQTLDIDVGDAHAALAALDREALTAVGVDIDQFEHLLTTATRPPGRFDIALTSGARAAIAKAVQATTIRTRRYAPAYLLLALLELARPDPAAELIERLGVDRTAVTTQLAGELRSA